MGLADGLAWEKEHGTEQSYTVEHTGGSSSYYMATILAPTTLGAPYNAECNDIIEALNMTFAEGNAFKAIWRTATARLGTTKKGNDAKYDAEKVQFFGARMEVHAALHAALEEAAVNLKEDT